MKNYTDEEFKEKLDLIIANYKSSYVSQEKPRAVFLGGQPGAGKSALENMINIKGDFASISGDDFRKYHPHFDEFNKLYGQSSSEYTQEWAGKMVEALIKEAKKEKWNVIIEGTLRTASLPIRDGKAFKEAGYSVELCVVAVKPEKSRLGTLQRYEEMLEKGRVPRMTPKAHHDLVVNNIANNLNDIYNEKIFENIRIYDRKNNLLYNFLETPNVNPKDILNKEFSREWKKEEIEDFQNKWEKLIEKLHDRKAPLEELKELKLEKEKTLAGISREKVLPQEKENLWLKKLNKEKDKGLGR